MHARVLSCRMARELGFMRSASGGRAASVGAWPDATRQLSRRTTIGVIEAIRKALRRFMDRDAGILRGGRPAGQRGPDCLGGAAVPRMESLLLSVDILRTGLRQSPSAAGAAGAAIGAQA